MNNKAADVQFKITHIELHSQSTKVSFTFGTCTGIIYWQWSVWRCEVLTSSLGLQIFIYGPWHKPNFSISVCHHTCWILGLKGISFPPLSSISLWSIFVIAVSATEKLLQKYDSESWTGDTNMDIQKFVIYTQKGGKIMQSVTCYSTSSGHNFCIQILV